MHPLEDVELVGRDDYWLLAPLADPRRCGKAFQDRLQSRVPLSSGGRSSSYGACFQSAMSEAGRGLGLNALSTGG